VVAFEQALAMPYASWVLAEMGADVIKVERPARGDVIRGWDSAVRGLSAGFVWVNAGKRDVAIDLANDEGQAVARRLAEGADVVLENFAPGAVARLGVGADEIRQANRRIVYCSLSGYGQDGPYRSRKAYDLLVQGESGILLLTGLPEAPVKVGVPITDLVAGSNAAMAVAMALYERDRTGEGRYIDVAMLDSTVSWLGYAPHHFWHSAQEAPRTGLRHPYIVPYGPFAASDGTYVSFAVASAEDWSRFCHVVVDKPEWLADPRFDTVAKRTSNRLVLEPLVEAAIAKRPASYWLQRLEESALPYGEVRNVESVLGHPQLVQRQMFVTADSPVGEVPLIRFPLAPPGRRRLPALGEHTDEVLVEAGFAPDEVARLRERGAVGG
jgi:crotonobetainyl-CoA:carnitine CoA-transferase CaiB-like acyl-CoA transferase